jgi:hypothetical protein
MEGSSNNHGRYSPGRSDGWKDWSLYISIEAFKQKGFIVQPPGQSIKSLGEDNNTSAGVVLVNMRN